MFGFQLSEEIVGHSCALGFESCPVGNLFVRRSVGDVLARNSISIMHELARMAGELVAMQEIVQVL